MTNYLFDLCSGTATQVFFFFLLIVSLSQYLSNENNIFHINAIFLPADLNIIMNSNRLPYIMQYQSSALHVPPMLCRTVWPTCVSTHLCVLHTQCQRRVSWREPHVPTLRLARAQWTCSMPHPPIKEQVMVSWTGHTNKRLQILFYLHYSYCKYLKQQSSGTDIWQSDTFKTVAWTTHCCK